MEVFLGKQLIGKIIWLSGILMDKPFTMRNFLVSSQNFRRCFLEPQLEFDVLYWKNNWLSDILKEKPLAPMSFLKKKLSYLNSRGSFRKPKLAVQSTENLLHKTLSSEVFLVCFQEPFLRFGISVWEKQLTIGHFKGEIVGHREFSGRER